MNRSSIIAQILDRFRRGGNALIVSHVSPDGDSIGSQLAAYDLLKALGCTPMIVNQDPAFPKYSFLEKHPLVNVHDRSKTYPQFDFALILEAPDLERIGTVRELLNPKCEILNVDHHPGNTNYGHINLVDQSVAAVGILVYEFFAAAGVELNKNNANELFTCILTDTGRFRFGSTNPEAMHISAELIKKGASTKQIADSLYATFGENQLRMLGEMLASMELHHNGQSCLMLADKNLRAKYLNGMDEMEGLSEYTLYTNGVKIGALLREVEVNRTKVSLRCQEQYDVAAIAAVHGGGGHRNAAGCHINLPFAQAKTRLLDQITEALA